MRILCLVLLFLSIGVKAQDTAVTAFLGILTLQPFYQQDSNWTKAESEVIHAHFVRLQQLVTEGKISMAGRVDLPSNDPEMFGLIIILPTTLQEAQKLMDEDPAVKAKIMFTKVLPFNIAVEKSD